MSDILKITTPIVPKNVTPIKPEQQPANIFNMVDLTRVVKNNEKDQYADTNTLLDNPTLAEKTFFNLIKEPNMAADALRKMLNAYIIAAGSGKNTSIDVAAFGRLYSSLTLNVEGVLQEMFNQSNGISIFKGDFFDVLRKLLAGNLNIKGQSQSLLDAISLGDYKNAGAMQNAKSESMTNILANTLFASRNPELTDSIVEVIKAFGYRNSAKDVISSIVSNLRFLGDIMPDKSQLQLQIQDAIRQFSSAVPYDKNWDEQYKQLSESLLTVLKTLDTSIFKTSRSENLSSLLLFNLSFLNSAEVNVDAAFAKLFNLLKDGEFKDNLKTAYDNVMQKIDEPESEVQSSKLMDNISKFVSENYRGSENSTIINSEINNILRSLIAAPNSFTPLQHYVLPLKYNDTQGFAELWIDPNEQRQSKTGGIEAITHLFFAIDVEPAGYFEVDMIVDDYKINASVLCPQSYANEFRSLKNELYRLTANTPYTFENINIDKLVKPKLLAGVFEKLSKKRAGFNVKV